MTARRSPKTSHLYSKSTSSDQVKNSSISTWIGRRAQRDAGAFGAGAVEAGEIVDSMGTAEAALITFREPPLDETGFNLNLNVGRHVLPENFYLVAGLPESGAAVGWLLRLLEGSEDDLARWTKAAEELVLGEGGVFLPLVRGEENGVSFYGLGKESRPAHLLRAVLEGLTLEIDAALKRAERAVETELSSFTVLGGGARNSLWRQLKAEMSGRPVRAVSEPEFLRGHYGWMRVALVLRSSLLMYLPLCRIPLVLLRQTYQAHNAPGVEVPELLSLVRVARCQHDDAPIVDVFQYYGGCGAQIAREGFRGLQQHFLSNPRLGNPVS